MKRATTSHGARHTGITRRAFLRAAGTASAVMVGSRLFAAEPSRKPSGTVLTVTGPVKAGALEFTLTHEHVLVDFIGAEKIRPGRYEPDDAFNRILPFLREVKELGCKSLVECTPAYLGRDPNLLARLSRASGLLLLTNTGYYGAADNKFLPKHAYKESADELAARWTREFHDGIDQTAIRPGFVKIGVGGKQLSDLHRKLVRAAARTHNKTGLTVASHTGPASLAMEQLDIFEEEHAPAKAFIWVHAQAEQDLEAVIAVGRRGCWVSFDGYSETEADRYLGVIRRFKQESLLKRLLLSHDAGWYKPGEVKGGEFRPFTSLQSHLLPRLASAGIEKPEVEQLFEKNPANAFGG